MWVLHLNVFVCFVHMIPPLRQTMVQIDDRTMVSPDTIKERQGKETLRRRTENRGGRRGSRPWHWGRVVPRYQGRDVAAVFLPLSLSLPLFSVIWRPGWNYDNKRKKKLLLWLLSHYVNYIKQALFVCICVRFWCVCKPEQPGATCMLTCACTSVFVCLFACVGVRWKNVCVCVPACAYVSRGYGC